MYTKIKNLKHVSMQKNIYNYSLITLEK